MRILKGGNIMVYKIIYLYINEVLYEFDNISDSDFE